MEKKGRDVRYLEQKVITLILLFNMKTRDPEMKSEKCERIAEKDCRGQPHLSQSEILYIKNHFAVLLSLESYTLKGEKFPAAALTM